MKEWWIKRVQTQDMQKPEFEQTRQMLNLVPNEDGVLECHGRVQGKHPVYIPADATFTRTLVQRIHAETLHGGVPLTMAAIREMYWIPTLRKLVKHEGALYKGISSGSLETGTMHFYASRSNRELISLRDRTRNYK